MKYYIQVLFLLVGFTVKAAGLNDGSSWEDAWTNLTSIVWTRGDTYYIAGGAYTAANYVMSAAASGTLWITLKKANAADNSGDPGWQASYATDQAVITGAIKPSSSYLAIDGVTGSGESGHGIKIVMDYPTYNTAVWCAANIGNLYFHGLEIVGPGGGVGDTGTDLVYVPNSTPQKGLHIDRCFVHGCATDAILTGQFQGTSWTDYGHLIENTVIADDRAASAGIHGQGIQMGCTTAGNRSSFEIVRNCTWRDIGGSGMLEFMSENHDNVLIYNNLFYIQDNTLFTYGVNNLSPNTVGSYGGTGGTSNVWILNNTFYHIQTPNVCSIQFFNTGVKTNIYCVNNVFESCNISYGVDPYVTHGTNGYYGNTGAGVPSGTPGQVNGSATTLLTPASYDLRLKSGGYALGVGANLASIFTGDYAGSTRAAPWDLGAYAYTTIPAPPAPGSVTIINAGNVTFR